MAAMIHWIYTLFICVLFLCGNAYVAAMLHRIHKYMMTSSNWNMFLVTGHLCGEFTGHQWIPLIKASDAGLWCFLWSAPWINGQVNNRKAGDLKCHRAHYDVIVIFSGFLIVSCSQVDKCITSPQLNVKCHVRFLVLLNCFELGMKCVFLYCPLSPGPLFTKR